LPIANSPISNTSLLSSARTVVPAYLTDFPQNNEEKQGEHGETV
jgi:hypothetical protein